MNSTAPPRQLCLQWLSLNSKRPKLDDTGSYLYNAGPANNLLKLS